MALDFNLELTKEQYENIRKIMEQDILIPKPLPWTDDSDASPIDDLRHWMDTIEKIETQREEKEMLQEIIPTLTLAELSKICDCPCELVKDHMNKTVHVYVGDPEDENRQVVMVASHMLMRINSHDWMVQSGAINELIDMCRRAAESYWYELREFSD